MDNETLFYVCGIVLAVSALVVSFAGLKMEKFPGKALPAVVLWFAVFVLAATTFAVKYSGEEHEAKAAEYAKFNEAETESSTEGEEPVGPTEGEKGGESSQGSEEANGGGGGGGGGTPSTTLKVEASPTALAFDTTSLTAKAGKVTIDFKNPAPIPHNVVIEENGKELSGFEPIAEGEESETAELKPGTYTFFCSVPGHREAGMEGTLTVK